MFNHKAANCQNSLGTSGGDRHRTRFYANADSASRTSILATLPPSLTQGGRDRGLKLFALRFELRFIFVGPDPNKFVLWPIHPGADDGYADLLVQRHDVLFEVLQKIIHLALLIV
jgi:hypothetical protein